jgi:hypothetical protein
LVFNAIVNVVGAWSPRQQWARYLDHVGIPRPVGSSGAKPKKPRPCQCEGGSIVPGRGQVGMTSTSPVAATLVHGGFLCRWYLGIVWRDSRRSDTAGPSRLLIYLGTRLHPRLVDVGHLHQHEVRSAASSRFPRRRPV